MGTGAEIPLIAAGSSSAAAGTAAAATAATTATAATAATAAGTTAGAIGTAGAVGGTMAGSTAAAAGWTVADSMLASAGIQAGAGLLSSSMAAKGAGKKPAPRSYLGEMQNALNAQANIYPQVAALERRYIPTFQDLQKQTLMGQIGTLKDIYGNATNTSVNMGQDIINKMSPLMGRIGPNAMQMYADMDPTAANIMSQMSADANRDLALGGYLSQEERNMANQAARYASQARGMQTGNQAVAEEVLSNYNLSRQREDARRAYAAQVLGLAQQTAGNAYNMYGAPLMNMISPVTPSGLVGQSLQFSQGLGPSMFTPESQYMADVMGSNSQNALSSQLAKAQIQAGLGSGLIESAGKMTGAYLGNSALFQNNNNNQDPLKPVTLDQKVRMGQARQIS